MLLSFVSTILAARLLGLEAFGVASALIAQSVFLHYILTFGLDQTLPTYKDRWQVEQIAAIGALVALVLGSLFVVALVGLDLQSEAQWSVRFLLLWQAVLTAIGAIFAGYLRFKGAFTQLIMKDQVLFPIGIVVTSGPLLWLLEPSLLIYATGYAATALIVVSIWFFLLRRELLGALSTIIKGRSERRWVVGALGQSAPIGLLSLVEIGVPWAVLIVISGFFESSAVGQLAVLIRYGALCTFVGLALGPLVSGLLPRLFWTSPDALPSATREIIYVTSLSAFLVAITLLMFAPELLRLVGASEVSWSVFGLVLTAFMLDGAALLSKFVIIAAGDRVLYLIGSAASLAISCVVAATITVSDGAVAGGVALVVGSFLMTAVRIALVRSLTGFWLMGFVELIKLLCLFLPIGTMVAMANHQGWPVTARLFALIPTVGIIVWVISSSLRPDGFFLGSLGRAIPQR